MSLGMSWLLPHVSFISCMNAVTRFKSCRVTRRQEVNSSFKMLCWLLWKPERIHFASYLPIKKVKILQGQGLLTLNFGKCTLAKTFLVSTSFENKTLRPNKTSINSHIAFKTAHIPINILGLFWPRGDKILSGERRRNCSVFCADSWNVLAFHFFLCVWHAGLTGSVLSQAGSGQTESCIHGQIKFMWESAPPLPSISIWIVNKISVWKLITPTVGKSCRESSSSEKQDFFIFFHPSPAFVGILPCNLLLNQSPHPAFPPTPLLSPQVAPDH